ncbi:hypothetical protein GCM10008023_39230 [Sphingomonas glacialis]|uniref:Uncharacterized protein n=1 Tax=Sphingomonas glacialis TaxID=658225 RepID=A0ABQ3LTD1_9SPHN|nr:hypothetical protein GCM10008023_39230 [Sphingomonas glacialis]
MRALPHMAVDRGSVGPVGLNRHDRKAMTLDQVTSYGGTGTIEFGSTMRRLTEQNDACAGEAIEGRTKGGVVQRRQGFGGGFGCICQWHNQRRVSKTHRKFPKEKGRSG